jgi:hypothetical protein
VADPATLAALASIPTPTVSTPPGTIVATATVAAAAATPAPILLTTVVVAGASVAALATVPAAAITTAVTTPTTAASLQVTSRRHRYYLLDILGRQPGPRVTGSEVIDVSGGRYYTAGREVREVTLTDRNGGGFGDHDIYVTVLPWAQDSPDADTTWEPPDVLDEATAGTALIGARIGDNATWDVPPGQYRIWVLLDDGADRTFVPEPAMFEIV